MITSVVFSKNRACQLDLLLRSIEKNLPQFENIWVLYEATTPSFFAGYELLISRFPKIHFIKQINFQTDTFYLLNNIACKYVCFFVDDNVITRKCSIIGSDILNTCVFKDQNAACFSLRLGTNIKIQDIYNNLPIEYPKDFSYYIIEPYKEQILLWNWTTIRTFGDFGYPFSVDGHIYQKKDILPFLTYEFDTPNAFEGRFDKNKLTQNRMYCFANSVIVNNPINIVGSSNNNAGKYYGYTLEELNNKYLHNNIINLEPIMQEKIIACHQEIQIQFKHEKV